MSIIAKQWNKVGLFATQGSTVILGIDIHRARHARARHARARHARARHA